MALFHICDCNMRVCGCQGAELLSRSRSSSVTSSVTSHDSPHGNSLHGNSHLAPPTDPRYCAPIGQEPQTALVVTAVRLKHRRRRRQGQDQTWTKPVHTGSNLVQTRFRTGSKQGFMWFCADSGAGQSEDSCSDSLFLLDNGCSEAGSGTNQSDKTSLTGLDQDQVESR